MYKAVFFDLDGTLLDRKKQIHPEVKEAIQKLQHQGTIVMIATGRAPYFFEHVRKELGIDSFVCINGTLVVYKNEIIHETTLPTETIQKFTDFATQHEHPVIYLTQEQHLSNTENHPYVIEDFTELRVAQPKFHPEGWKTKPVYQIISHFREEFDDVYRAAFPELRIIRWSPTAIDAIPTGMSKAEGIKIALEILNIRPEEAAAFGDGFNDVEMLSMVGMGVAMGNSVPVVKEIANYVTTDVEDHGVVNGLKHIGLL